MVTWKDPADMSVHIFPLEKVRDHGNRFDYELGDRIAEEVVDYEDCDVTVTPKGTLEGFFEWSFRYDEKQFTLNLPVGVVEHLAQVRARHLVMDSIDEVIKILPEGHVVQDYLHECMDDGWSDLPTDEMNHIDLFLRDIVRYVKKLGK